MRKEDRRIRRTRRQLSDALIELILERGYAAITVQEIADRADLSRATFYLHFKDKNELLIAALEARHNALLESVEWQETSSLLDEKRNLAVIRAFEHAYEHCDLYRALLGEGGVSLLIRRELKYLAMVTERRIRATSPRDAHLSIPIEFMAHHSAGALFSLLIWWLENDMPYTPEQMAEMFFQLLLPGILRSIGIATSGGDSIA